MSTRATRPALDELATYLRWHHPNYTINDVAPTDTRGYLRCTKPCPRTAWYCNHRGDFYHTISLEPRKGYGRGQYAFWRAVCAALRERGQA